MALIAAAGLVAAACSDTGGSTSAQETSAQETSSITAQLTYPPNDFGQLAAIFDPLVEPLGLRLTRGALIDRTGGNYAPSDTGTHLALYVEPIDDSSYGDEEYIEGIFDVTAAVTSVVFERWSAVETYDICQEPHQADDDRVEPYPVTQVELDRAAALSYDFETGDLPSLIDFLQSTEGARLLVVNELVEHPAYQQALRSGK